MGRRGGLKSKENKLKRSQSLPVLFGKPVGQLADVMHGLHMSRYDTSIMLFPRLGICIRYSR